MTTPSWVTGPVNLAFSSTLAGYGSEERRPVQAHALNGLLAVHRGVGRWWILSHIPTGRHIPCSTRATLRESKALAEQLLAVVDWRRITDKGPNKRQVARLLAVLAPGNEKKVAL